MIKRVETKQINIENKEFKYIDCNGSIDKVKISIELLSDECEIEIYTAFGEKIISYKGNHSVVLYPRNNHISKGIYSSGTPLNDIETSVIERWVNTGMLKIVIDNKGDNGLISNIEVVYDER